MRALSLPGVLLALAIAAKCLFALHVGLSLTPDSIGYLRIADAVTQGGLGILAEHIDLRIKPRAELNPTLWHDFAPLLAYRMVGYPLIIAAIKGAFGAQWVIGMLMLQAACSIVTCILLYRLSRALDFGAAAALTVALVYAISPILDSDNALLTDSLYASLVACLAMAIAIEILSGRPVALAKSLGFGFMLAAAMLLRESTQFLAIGLIPLVALWCARTKAPLPIRISLGLVFFVPLVATTAAYTFWNYARTGETFVTTVAQVTAVHPIFEAELYRIENRARSGSAFDTDSQIDVVARAMGCPGGVETRECLDAPVFPRGVIGLCRELNLRLSEQFGSDSLSISRMGRAKFFSLWTTRPELMLGPMPGRIVKSLTVLRPLDLRFAFAELPADVKVLRPLESDSLSRAAPPPSSNNSANDTGLLRSLLSESYFIGKILSALAVSCYLMMSIWVAGRLCRSMFSRYRPPFGLDDLLIIALAFVVWTFLLFHAAIHIEARYLLPVAPLILISFVLMVGNVRTRRTTGTIRPMQSSPDA